VVAGEVLVPVGALGVELPTRIGEELRTRGTTGVGRQRIAEGEVLAVGPLITVGVGVVRVGASDVQQVAQVAAGVAGLHRGDVFG
jgi:hypothetical protein